MFDVINKYWKNENIFLKKKHYGKHLGKYDDFDVVLTEADLIPSSQVPPKTTKDRKRHLSLSL